MPSYTAKELERETGVDRRTIAYYVQEGLLPKVGRRGRRTRYPGLFRDRLLFIRRVREAEEAGEVSTVPLSDIRRVFERVPPALIAGVADGRIAVTPELVSEPSTAFRTPGARRATLRERWGGGGRAMESMPVPWSRAPEGSSARPRAKEEYPDDRTLDPPVGDIVARDVTARDEAPPVGAPDEVAERLYRRYGLVAESPDEPDPAPPDPEPHALVESLGELAAVARHRNEESPRSSRTWTRIRFTRDLVLSVRGIGEEDAALVERVRQAMRRVLRER